MEWEEEEKRRGQWRRNTLLFYRKHTASRLEYNRLRERSNSRLISDRMAEGKHG